MARNKRNKGLLTPSEARKQANGETFSPAELYKIAYREARIQIAELKAYEEDLDEWEEWDCHHASNGGIGRYPGKPEHNNKRHHKAVAVMLSIGITSHGYWVAECHALEYRYRREPKSLYHSERMGWSLKWRNDPERWPAAKELFAYFLPRKYKGDI